MIPFRFILISDLSVPGPQLDEIEVDRGGVRVMEAALSFGPSAIFIGSGAKISFFG